MDYQPLKYIYRPVPGESYTLLLLHGTGGDEQDLLSLAHYFGNNMNLLSLRGNVLEHGMPRFFRRISMGVFDEDDLRFRTGEMAACIQGLSKQEGFDPNKIIALGYSNGANIAAASLLLYPSLLAGAILFRPMRPFREEVTPPGFHTAVPVFMSSGAQDPTVAEGASEAYATWMQTLGFQVQHEVLPAGHQLTHRDIELAATWCREHFPAAF
ncbi:alpha/beta hydrolase [Chitinophaga pendula]|uniref:alpha/beta hydrolase n=1 Tax=Chitinophaga TaxID=79328 RepID=UPI000BAEE64E|nr:MULTISPECIES: alpha/beta hydrolase [Chitinophaga]ASZ12381.1 hydrolase [Chitinophaga sp. MD30]UCJ10021.1 alpha/beta hydrolase [Chitinophaga pendula]